MSTERIISIYSSRGGAKTITTGVTTWKELLPLVKAQGYPVNDLHVTENVRKTTLEHEDAILPEGDFTLFMRPKKTKSGAKGKRADGLNKKELTALLKKDIASSSNGKEFYAGYSSMTVADLAVKVNTFKAKLAKEKVSSKTTATKKVTTPVKKAVAKVVKSVKESKEVVETSDQLARRLETEAKQLEKGFK